MGIFEGGIAAILAVTLINVLLTKKYVKEAYRELNGQIYFLKKLVEKPCKPNKPRKPKKQRQSRGDYLDI